jgi:hypothetical protein
MVDKLPIAILKMCKAQMWRCGAVACNCRVCLRKASRGVDARFSSALTILVLFRLV